MVLISPIPVVPIAVRDATVKTCIERYLRKSYYNEKLGGAASGAVSAVTQLERQLCNRTYITGEPPRNKGALNKTPASTTNGEETDSPCELSRRFPKEKRETCGIRIYHAATTASPRYRTRNEKLSLI